MLKASEITTIILVILVLALLVWVIYKMMHRRSNVVQQPLAEHFRQPVHPEFVLRRVGVPITKNESFEAVHQEMLHPADVHSESHVTPVTAPTGAPVATPATLSNAAPVNAPVATVAASTQKPVNVIPAAKNVDFGKPFVDSKVGVLIDGPGYEQQTDDWTFGEPTTGIPSNYYFLDDGAGGQVSIQHNLCSKSCCAEQWPTPFKMKYDPYVCELKKKGELVGSNYFCNNTFQDSGCLCLTKDQGRFLYSRGGNGQEWF